jgi:hypothetical protein
VAEQGEEFGHDAGVGGRFQRVECFLDHVGVGVREGRDERIGHLGTFAGSELGDGREPDIDLRILHGLNEHAEAISLGLDLEETVTSCGGVGIGPRSVGLLGDLLGGVSRAVINFQRDLEQLGLSDRVLTVLYSEFGRRPGQNSSSAGAGTDHGRAGVTMLMGEGVAGGLHGTIPRLDDLDATHNLKVNTDFRRVYAAIIDDWLGGDHTALLPGAPFAPLPVIL